MTDSLSYIISESERSGRDFFDIVIEEDMKETGKSRDESFSDMRDMYRAMKDSIFNYNPELKSHSGMTGTDGAKITKRITEGKMICGPLISKVMERALMVAESNACMKRIVAAPTAGSCGVMPAVLVTAEETYDFDEDKMVEALFVAGGIGGVIACRASLAGATGGCQAEIGSASAMAAGALTFLFDNDARKIANSAALALKGLMGLVCDPVAGLVEVPCVKRNVIGAVNAVTCTDMTLAGIESKIPPDEVIDAMRAVGRCMVPELKETGKGGLAGTLSACRIRDELKKGKER